MSTDPEKLLFRLKHIIPKELSSAKIYSFYNNSSNETFFAPPNQPNVPREVVFQMTYGKMAAKIWGPPTGRPVFAIHGWLDNAASFDTLIPLLPKDLQIVAVDMPGHGLSDPFPCDISYNFVDCLVAIERFAKYLKWEKFSFLAHCMGACMAMLYAGVFPEKVDKLICLDMVRVITTIPETMDIRLRKTVGKLLKYEEAIIAGPEKPMSYDEAVQRVVSGTFGSVDERGCKFLLQRGLREVPGGYVFSRDRRMFAAPLSFAPKEDMLILARKVTADVLVIKFSEGPYFESVENYLEHVDALRTNAKQVQYVEMEGKHHAHLTHPERFAPLITEFLNA